MGIHDSIKNHLMNLLKVNVFEIYLDFFFNYKHKIMIKYNILLLIIITSTSFAQNKYKVIEGFYNLPNFEVDAGIYLLENKTFFYYASFGNVDLKVFGEYSVCDNNEVKLFVDENLTKEFKFYGLKNNALSDNIVLNYKQPYSQNAEHIYVIIDGYLENFPAFTPGNETVSLKLPMPKSGILKFGYQISEGSNNTKKITQIDLSDGINDLKIFHNYNAQMNFQISQISFKVANGVLTDNSSTNPKTTKKQDLTEVTKSEVIGFIDYQRSKNSVIIDGKTYLQL